MSKNINADNWLAQVDLTLADIQANKRNVKLFQATKLANTAVNYFSNSGSLGIEFGKMLNVHTHGELGNLLMTSKTFGDALVCIDKYSLTRSQLVKTSIKQTEQNNIFQIKTLIPFTQHKFFAIETAFACFHRIRSSLLQQDSPECQLFLSYEPSNKQQFEAYFGPNISYNQKVCEYHFPITDNEIALVNHNQILQTIHLTACEQNLERVVQPIDFATQVQDLLLQQHESLPDLDTVAKALFVSSRTLRRKLKTENTSFQQILETVRKELAVTYLQEGKDDIQMISLKLGYSDVANFNRAFKRWFAMAPSSYKV